MRLEFIVYSSSRVLDDSLLGEFTHLTDGYLFPVPVVTWQPAEGLRGRVECEEEDGFVLLGVLRTLTKVFPGRIARVVDANDGDWLLLLCADGLSAECEECGARAFLCEGNVHVVLLEGEEGEENVVERIRSKKVGLGNEHVQELAFGRFHDEVEFYHAAMQNSKHVVRIGAPLAALRLLQAVPELIPAAACAFADAKIDKAVISKSDEGERVMSALSKGPDTFGFVRFTRLSYATLRGQTLKINAGRALMEGIGHLILAQDTFEEEWKEFSALLEKRGIVSMDQDMEERARKKLHSAKTSFSRDNCLPQFVTWKPLRRMLENINNNCNVEFASALADFTKDDNDAWLYDKPKDADEDFEEEKWEAVANALEKLEIEESLKKSAAAVSTRLKQGPMQFDEKLFFKFLSGAAEDAEDDFLLGLNKADEVHFTKVDAYERDELERAADDIVNMNRVVKT